MRLIILLLLSTSLARADTRADLETALAALAGHDAINATVELSLSSQSGDKKEPEESKATARVDAGPEGLQIFWSREQVAALAPGYKPDASADRPAVRKAMDALSITALDNYLNIAPEFLRALETAELTGDRDEAWEGQPARLLTFKVNPPIGEKERKYIKELDATAQIWVGADGVPLAAKRHVRVKGRAMVVIGFESTEDEEFQFTRSGDRLVVVHHEKKSNNSGGGNTGQRTLIANLTLGSR